MNIELNDNNELISFLNNLLKDEELTKVAPNIIKFFIITRNYGLIDYENNLNKLKNNDNFEELCLKIIENGFRKDNIEFNSNNLTNFLIKNFHENGFYFHSFPGIYKDSIRENGLLANNRNSDDDKYFEIVDKYHFGEYFKKSNNRICVTEKIGNPYTTEYAIFTPEWLEMFLKQGNKDIHDAFQNGNIDEMQEIATNSLIYFNNGMQRNPQYNNNDFFFLAKYIKNIINERFINGNNEVGIALIEKKKSDEYFKKHIQIDEADNINNFIKSHNMNPKQILDFITNSLVNGEITTDKNIPSDLINIISYQIKNNEIEQSKIIK